MNPAVDASIINVRVSNDALHVVLADGRELAAPLAWFPRLRDASPSQQADWQLLGRGNGIHWPQVDEDISAASLLRLT